MEYTSSFARAVGRLIVFLIRDGLVSISACVDVASVNCSSVSHADDEGT